MAFWDKVSSELKKAAHEGWAAVKEGAKLAGTKGEEVAKHGRFRYRAYTTHKEAESLFTELGGAVYDMARPPYENPLSNPAVMRLIERIKKIEAETASLEQKIEGLGRKPPSGPATSAKPTAQKFVAPKAAPLKKAASNKPAGKPVGKLVGKGAGTGVKKKAVAAKKKAPVVKKAK